MNLSDGPAPGGTLAVPTASRSSFRHPGHTPEPNDDEVRKEISCPYVLNASFNR